MSYSQRIMVRRCKYCLHPLGHSGVIGNLVVCPNCFSSYQILSKRPSNTGLVVVLAFAITFAGHLAWTSGHLGVFGGHLRQGIQQIKTLIAAEQAQSVKSSVKQWP